MIIIWLVIPKNIYVISNFTLRFSCRHVNPYPTNFLWRKCHLLLMPSAYIKLHFVLHFNTEANTIHPDQGSSLIWVHSVFN